MYLHFTSGSIILKKLLTTLYWGIQINAVIWLIVVVQCVAEYPLTLIGLLVAAVLEHLAVKRLGPELKRMSE
jgi:hypothetical protein